MTSLAQAISGLLGEYGLEQGVRLQRAVSLWSQVVGPAVARNCPAVRVQGDTLMVRAKSAAWRNEISFQKNHILDTLNQALGSSPLSDIRFC